MDDCKVKEQKQFFQSGRHLGGSFHAHRLLTMHRNVMRNIVQAEKVKEKFFIFQTHYLTFVHWVFPMNETHSYCFIENFDFCYFALQTLSQGLCAPANAILGKRKPIEARQAPRILPELMCYFQRFCKVKEQKIIFSKWKALRRFIPRAQVTYYAQKRYAQYRLGRKRQRKIFHFSNPLLDIRPLGFPNE